MLPRSSMLRDILVDPVTLRPTQYDADPFWAARPGGTSNKNDKETEHFLKAYSPKSAAESNYARRITALPKPVTTADSIILDIGCGPYDCISAIDGQHIFLDDIMDAYVSKLRAKHDGLRICARTEQMPLKSGSVDLVYSINMIDHVDDMPETVAEMHRVLKPGAKVYLQTYYNSHPLLETEPGVFDRYFLDQYISPLFDYEYIRTFAQGDPNISSSYTMDILAAVLVKKDGVEVSRKPRERYLDPDYLGPQSLISNAIRSLSVDQLPSKQLKSLADDKCYGLHHALLEAWSNIVRGNYGAANTALKGLLTVDRVRGNPYARIAIYNLENKRILGAMSAKLAEQKP